MLDDRHAMAVAVRTAVWGKPEDMALLCPGRTPPARHGDDTVAEALAGFGLIEEKTDE
jgi:hypothetical protein